MSQVKFIIVADKSKLFQSNDDRLIVTPKDFINKADGIAQLKKPPKIINISNRYDYLSKGYYVSLLAEARGLACIPDVSNIITLNWRRNYEFAFADINEILKKNYNLPFEEPSERTFTTFFGRHDDPRIEPVSRFLYDVFRFPIMSFRIKYGQAGRWVIDRIDTPSFHSLIDRQVESFHEALAKFTGNAWKNKPKNKKQERYWLAILYDPSEAMPPSNKKALQHFKTTGQKLGIWSELITKNDFSSLLEYDALFIRETTSITNHTFRFANKAEQEGIPCIDDTASIIRCCNKVFLKELLEIHKVPTPPTQFLDRQSLDQLSDTIGYPAVLKIPDGSFSKGVLKVRDEAELKVKAQELFKKTEIILCQKFMPSSYDWRIGVLNNAPLFAAKYFMADNHWQIYNHEAKTRSKKSGDHISMNVDDVPDKVMEIALKAGSLIGSGLYGIDLKELEDGSVIVIEVNDNPNIDSGVEDEILGEKLYKTILEHIIKLIDA